MPSVIFRHPLWGLLLLLIASRPWIASLAFPDVEYFWQITCSICALFTLYARRPRAAAVITAGSWRRPLACWPIALLVAAVRSPDPLQAAHLCHATFNGLLLFLLAAQATEDDAHRIRAVLLVSLVVLSGYGLWQATVGFPGALRYLEATHPADVFGRDYLTSGRIIATFISPDLFSGYLIAVGAALAAAATDSAGPRGPARWLAFAAALALLNLLIARSLGAWLSLSATIGLWLICRPTRSATASPHRGVWPMLILGALLAIVITARWDTLADAANPHNPIVQRWRYWQSAAAMWRDHPLLGVGLGGFGLAYERYRLPGASETLFAHNSYLQLGAETGWLGAVPLIWLLTALLRDAVRRCRRGDGIAVWALPGALAFLLHNLVNFDWYLPEVAIHGWLLLGLSLSSCCTRETVVARFQ